MCVPQQRLWVGRQCSDGGAHARCETAQRQLEGIHTAATRDAAPSFASCFTGAAEQMYRLSNVLLKLFVVMLGAFGAIHAQSECGMLANAANKPCSV